MNRRSILFTLLLAGGAAVVAVAPVWAQQPGTEAQAGRTVYDRSCAACHAGADPRAPALTTLQMMTADYLRHALTDGIMAPQGAMLTAQERAALIQYLAAPDVTHDAWIASNMCSADQRRPDLTQPVSMGIATVDLVGSRNLSAQAAGLTRRDLERLEVAWAIAFPGVTNLRSAPVIVGSTLFYSATATAKVLALDTQTGCVRWAYDAGAPLRSSVVLGEPVAGGRPTLYFGDGRGQLHAVDAATGARLWVVNALVDEGVGMITGSPVVYEGKVIVPISGSGVSAASNPNFECCIGRGAVNVLSAATGERIWVYYTMEAAQYTGAVNSVGARLRGPSGAPIWTTPTIDERRRRIYVTTGENTSHPATGTSDAIIALDLDTGRELWIQQTTPNDVWNMACTGRGGGPNCPTGEGSILRDWDFGSSAVLVQLPNGRDIIVAGQKSGHVWGINPEDGSVLWEQRVGEGSALGGNHWGIAVDGQRVFVPINDPLGGNPVPGMYVFDIATGTPVWQHRLEPDCSPERRERQPGCAQRYGLSAMPLVVDGAVISAGIDGRVFIFDGETGRVLFQYDTARPYTGVNGVQGNGGSIDSHSIAAGAGMVFIGSGYGMFSQTPGNVLLAFRPRP